jgi:hypothetical protein
MSKMILLSADEAQEALAAIIDVRAENLLAANPDVCEADCWSFEDYDEFACLNVENPQIYLLRVWPNRVVSKQVHPSY